MLTSTSTSNLSSLSSYFSVNQVSRSSLHCHHLVQKNKFFMLLGLPASLSYQKHQPLLLIPPPCTCPVPPCPFYQVSRSSLHCHHLVQKNKFFYASWPPLSIKSLDQVSTTATSPFSVKPLVPPSPVPTLNRWRHLTYQVSRSSLSSYFDHVPPCNSTIKSHDQVSAQPVLPAQPPALLPPCSHMPLTLLLLVYFFLL